MKRVLFLFGLIGCLLFSSFPGFANETEAAKEEYKEAISEKDVEGKHQAGYNERRE